jgi:GNAT superfamily N-acetyltransferase
MHRTPLKFEQLSASTPQQLVDQIACLHMQQISSGFLTTLGRPFLVCLYEAMVTSPDAFVIAATRGDQLTGFICGSTNTRSVYRHFIRRKGLAAALAALPQVAAPRQIAHLWETWRYPMQVNVNLPAAEVLNFCVAPSCLRQGIGRDLFGRLSDEFCRRQVNTIKIVTGIQQKSAQRFYESIGARLVHQFQLHRGSESLIYIYKLRDARPTTAQETAVCSSAA